MKLDTKQVILLIFFIGGLISPNHSAVADEGSKDKLNKPEIEIVNADDEEVREVKYSRGELYGKRYRIKLKYNNPGRTKCFNIIGEIKTVDKNGSFIMNLDNTYAPIKIDLAFETLDNLTCISKKTFILTTLPKDEIESSVVIPLYGGIGNMTEIKIIE